MSLKIIFVFYHQDAIYSSEIEPNRKCKLADVVDLKKKKGKKEKNVS